MRAAACLAQLVLLLRLPGRELALVGLLLLQQAFQDGLFAVQVAVRCAQRVLHGDEILLIALCAAAPVSTPRLCTPYHCWLERQPAVIEVADGILRTLHMLLSVRMCPSLCAWPHRSVLTLPSRSRTVPCPRPFDSPYVMASEPIVPAFLLCLDPRPMFAGVPLLWVGDDQEDFGCLTMLDE